MATINTWINFNGNAEEAFTFYKSVFGGEFSKVVRFKDIASAEFQVEEKEENKILYIALPIGTTSMLICFEINTVLNGSLSFLLVIEIRYLTYYSFRLN